MTIRDDFSWDFDPPVLGNRKWAKKKSIDLFCDPVQGKSAQKLVSDLIFWGGEAVSDMVKMTRSKRDRPFRPCFDFFQKGQNGG